MGKTIRVTLSCPADYAEVLAADAKPALAGEALCKLILLSRKWHVGATDLGEGGSRSAWSCCWTMRTRRTSSAGQRRRSPCIKQQARGASCSCQPT